MDMKSIVLYLSRKGLNAEEIHNDIIDTLGPNVISYQTVTRYLRSQSFFPRKSPHEKVANNSNVEENKILVQNALKISSFSSIREIAKMIHVSKSTVRLLKARTVLYSLWCSRHLAHDCSLVGFENTC